MRILIILLLFALTIFTACKRSPVWENSIESLLLSQPQRFGKVMQNPEKYRVQIMYTQIDRDAENRPSFRTFTYRVDPGEYFYPASTVKLPTVALALEKLNHLNRPGLNRDTTMLTGSAADFQTVTDTDETSPTGLPSVAHYSRKILLVSDNEAYNRLYEFVGPRELNHSLRQKGFHDSRIVHRLEIALSKRENQWTNPIRFVNGETVVYEQSDMQNEISYFGKEPERLGIAEIVDGKRLERPKDFSEKNAYPLMDQHEVIKNLLFPDSVGPEKRFDISEDDYRFLYQYMSMYPGESGIEAYQDQQKYPQGYVKFLMFGGDTESIPPHIRIFNKVGDAYGFLTDAAYIVDFKNKVEFILSATIYTNENGTFNDNLYEYDGIGMPFLKNLGQAIYEIELERDRKYKPDLSRLRDPQSRQ